MARRSRKRWSDLSTGQRAGIAAAAGAQVALLVAALIDLRRRPASEVNGSKATWTGVVFINYLGPLAYFAFGRRK